MIKYTAIDIRVRDNGHCVSSTRKRTCKRTKSIEPQ